MAKLLSICLRTMLPIAIHPIQLGFIRQRSILDNVYIHFQNWLPNPNRSGQLLCLILSKLMTLLF